MSVHKQMANRRMEHQNGSSMIEVLVTILIVTIGLLGIAAFFVRSQQMGDEAYQRFQALHVAHQLAEALSTDRIRAGSSVNPAANPVGYITGTDDDGTLSPAGLASFDTSGPDALTVFHNALIGASKTSGGENIATLLAAVGCVESVGAGTAADPVRYRISVAWQGRQASANPVAGSSTCAQTEYGVGNEALRRVVSLEVQVF